VLEGVSDAADIAIVAQRIVDVCREPVTVTRHRLRTGVSIGVVVFPDDGADTESLLKCADLAMYEAKAQGGGCYRFFNPEMLTSSLQRMTLREELTQALDQGEFALYYQPLQRLEDGRVTGMEALLRWVHPERGIVAPMSFIPEAERSGMIVPIGRWVLETACQQLAAWSRAGAADLTVAVNVSARQLRSPNFVDTVRSALADSGVEPSRVELEITESAAFEDFALAQEVLANIADLGVRIMIDDFGSGYSSLNRLKTLPVHGLKIDRFFLRDITSDPHNAAIIMAVVTMAHSLGIEVVAEGIETAEQLEFLRTMDWPARTTPRCDRVQGFFFGRPEPAEHVTRMLQAPGAGHSRVA
jgi:EAL domain-containing protein (putative c-di-GMP-specific phosphodiesterase class I)